MKSVAQTNGRFVDITGRVFGRLSVIARAENSGPAAMWLCRCLCGVERAYRGGGLRNGSITSCGCSRLKERAIPTTDPPEGRRFIALTLGKFAVVDEADFDRLSRFAWRADERHGTYYAVRTAWNPTTRKETNVYMHRQIVACDDTLEVDHKDGNGLFNSRCNLRVSTRRQNTRNKHRSENQKRGWFKGVTWDKTRKLWAAAIGAGPIYEKGPRSGCARTIALGRFDDPESAARAYDAAARMYFGEFALVNFPKDLVNPQASRPSAKSP